MSGTTIYPEPSYGHAFWARADDGRLFECVGGGHADWGFGPADMPLDVDGFRPCRFLAHGSHGIEFVLGYLRAGGWLILDD